MLIALAACGGSSSTGHGETTTATTSSESSTGSAATAGPILVPPGHPSEGLVWVIGFAQTGKAGPLVETDVGPVYATDIKEWPAELVGRPVIVEGTLSTVHHGSMESADGTVKAGLSGDQRIVSTSKPPPLVDDGLLDAERNLVAAFERHDRAALEQMVSASFQLHINGKVRTRDDMLKSMLVPELEKVSVVGLASHRHDRIGIVSGKQVAKVREQGALSDDANYFVDVFERQGDRWILTIAYAK